jgi:hypothetical protein
MRNSEQKKLEQILKDNLSEGTAQVPDFVWDRIEEELFPEKKRRGFFWWFFGGLCILLIGGLIALAVCGQGAHSQHNTLPNSTFSSNNFLQRKHVKSLTTKRKSTKTTTALISADKNETHHKGSFHTNFFPPKGNSSVSAYKQQTGSKNDPRSQVSTANRLSKRQSSELALRKSSKSKRLLSIASAGETFDKTNDGAVNKGGRSSADSKVENGNLSTNQKDSITPSTSFTSAVPTKESEIHLSHELSYEEILALVKRDFAENLPELQENKNRAFFSLGIYGGPSLYNTATFKEYFTSGQLSKRTFASSGFELGLQARFKVGNRFKIYTGVAFNQKQTQFTYNLAITEADYFTYIENGEKVPLENIHDDGMNSCFLAKDVTAKYQLQTLSMAIGTSFEFLRIGKFSAAADLRLSGNLYSSLKLKEMLVLDIKEPKSEIFSYLQPGAGLLVNFRVNQRLSLGLAPFFSKQFYLKQSFSRKLVELVIPLTVSFDL